MSTADIERIAVASAALRLRLETGDPVEWPDGARAQDVSIALGRTGWIGYYLTCGLTRGGALEPFARIAIMPARVAPPRDLQAGLGQSPSPALGPGPLGSGGPIDRYRARSFPVPPSPLARYEYDEAMTEVLGILATEGMAFLRQGATPGQLIDGLEGNLGRWEATADAHRLVCLAVLHALVGEYDQLGHCIHRFRAVVERDVERRWQRQALKRMRALEKAAAADRPSDVNAQLRRWAATSARELKDIAPDPSELPLPRNAAMAFLTDGA